jgi:antitoxin (DNA-binding transcriptional repressor) of toxin-antitoxin stability system
MHPCSSNGWTEYRTKSKIAVMDVGVHEAKTHFSKLLRRVAMGEEINIRDGNRVVARLVPPPATGAREFGRDRGRFEVPDDFNSRLPDEVFEAFES